MDGHCWYVLLRHSGGYQPELWPQEIRCGLQRHMEALVRALLCLDLRLEVADLLLQCVLALLLFTACVLSGRQEAASPWQKKCNSSQKRLNGSL